MLISTAMPMVIRKVAGSTQELAMISKISETNATASPMIQRGRPDSLAEWIVPLSSMFRSSSSSRYASFTDFQSCVASSEY